MRLYLSLLIPKQAFKPGTMTDQTPKESKVYFKNLTGLRAIGAFQVLIGHIEFLKYFWNIPAFNWFPVDGKIGVTLFFALSGFLITSLLLQELEVTKTVRMKQFYLRRIFRILPLYYITVFLCLFIFNKIEFLKIPGYSDASLRDLSWANILIVIFLLPNFYNFRIPYADQRWSIVVEEQFYLFQPFFVRLLKKRALLFILFTLVALSPEILSLGVKIFNLDSRMSPRVIEAIGSQLKYLGCISMGCLFSILYFKRDTFVKRILCTKTAQWLTLGLILTLIVLGYYVFKKTELIDYRLYSLLFSIIVCNAALNPNTIFRLENKTLNFLGSISYGIYMYHPICIGFGIALATRLSSNLTVQNLILYPIGIGLTILVSWFSFTYIESFFLKLKSGFSVLKFKKNKKMPVEV